MTRRPRRPGLPGNLFVDDPEPVEPRGPEHGGHDHQGQDPGGH